MNKNNCRAVDEKTRERLGCGKELPEYLWLDLPFGVVVKGCPYCEVMEMPEILEYFKFYEFFKMGHSIAGGGILNQPAKLMDVFELIGKVRGR